MNKHDPKKTFVIWSITRADIAASLNEANEDYNGEPKHDFKPFTEDDERLTNVICQEIADSLNDGVVCQLDDIPDKEHEVFEGVLESLIESKKV
jgi:hypothetical protein